MDTFIEVVGQGAMQEKVVEYRVDLSATVRAAQGETALKESADLRNRCIRTLKENGLADEELSEGGSEVWRAWFWKRKPGQEVSSKILVACADQARLLKALAALEPLFAGARETLSVSMRQPKFETSSEERHAAMSNAIADARRSAETIARASALKITGVSQVEEIGDHKGRSGVYGDEDWRWAAAGGAATMGAEEAPQSLEAATRRVMVRYRVRFSVEQVK